MIIGERGCRKDRVSDNEGNSLSDKKGEEVSDNRGERGTDNEERGYWYRNKVCRQPKFVTHVK